MDTVEVHGRTVAYRRAGSGPPLVPAWPMSSPDAFDREARTFLRTV